MKPKTIYSKMDIIVTAGCIIFLLGTIGAVGPGGQRHAKEMLCLSQLHKWGEVFQDYLHDNDGYFMKGYVYDASYASDLWMEALRPYYKKPQMRVCPEATVLSSEITGSGYIGTRTFVGWGVFDGGWSSLARGDYGSYGMNGWVYNSPSDSPWGLPPYYLWRVANVAGADNVPLFLDSLLFDGWPQHYDYPPPFEGYWDLMNDMGQFCINRHRGYVNSLFLDFSVRKVGLKELWTLKWHREFDTCGPWTTCGGMQPSYWPVWMRDFEDY